MVRVIEVVTVVLFIAWGMAGLLRRASASLRHAVWVGGLAAALLVTPLRAILPSRSVSVPIVSVTTQVAAAQPEQSNAVNQAWDWPSYVVLIWSMGTAVMLFRLLTMWVKLRALVRRASGRSPVLIGSTIHGPIVAGFVRPVVLLPDAARTWTPARRRAVLAHEFAHIRRRDPATLLLSHVVTAIYWFHPLCWLAAARLRTESEQACDDAALNKGFLPSGYAGHLLGIARSFHPKLAIPMASTAHLEIRVKSILNSNINRTAAGRGAWLTIAASAAAVLIPLTSLTVAAQQTTGSATIAGMVTDATGARVPNAAVTLLNTDTDFELTATTNAIGNYVFANIPAGHYALETQVPGFRRFRSKGLLVVNGAKLQADAHMEVGDVRQYLTVAGHNPNKAEVSKPSDARPLRIGGMVQAANLIRQVKPEYPAELQTQGIEGTVLVRAVISKEGVPLSLKVIKGAADAQLDAAALAAVTQWRYKPSLLNGEPIEVATNIEVEFRLGESPSKRAGN